MEFRPARVRLLGAEVDLITPAQVLEATARMVVTGRPGVIANHNSHSLYLLARSPPLRAFFDRADIIEIDSTPLIAWGKLLGLPLKRAHRSTYLDWQDDFWRLASLKGWRVFYLGGEPGVVEAANKRIGERWPGAVLDGHHGYFDISTTSAENQAVVAKIAPFAPDIIFVGMGMPRQEAWILGNRQALPHGVMFSIGAAYDYEVGVQAAAPRWMGRVGLEWLFRLGSQPQRLAFRYLIEPWFLAPAALADLRAAWARRTAPAPVGAGTAAL